MTASVTLSTFQEPIIDEPKMDEKMLLDFLVLHKLMSKIASFIGIQTQCGHHMNMAWIPTVQNAAVFAPIIIWKF